MMDETGARLRPGIEGAIWPALPDGTAAYILSVLWQLERTQWWPVDRLRDHQNRQLKALLSHAAQHVPYYERRLRDFGANPSLFVEPESWRAIPPLTRADIQNAGARLHNRQVPKSHGALSQVKTSGSTGQPVTVVKTGLSQIFWCAIAMRDHAWHRRQFDLKAAIIRANPAVPAEPPDGAVQPNWGPPATYFHETGQTALLRLGADVDLQAAWLVRHDPAYLMTYPTNLAALLVHFREHGIRLPSLREVRAVGETVSSDLRALCREVLGVPLVDMYSSQEVGYMALQCPESEDYHVQSESVLLEVVDDAGRPCEPGEIGRVLVTPLHNFAMPLLRYEIRDYAEVGAPCRCGRGLPTLKRIVGRERNMVMLPGGKRRWPLVGFHEYEAIAPIRQYQFVQRSLERIEMRLVVARPVSADEEGRLTEVVQRSLGHPFAVDFVYLDAIPIGANGKFEEFLCAVPSA